MAKAHLLKRCAVQRGCVLLCSFLKRSGQQYYVTTWVKATFFVEEWLVDFYDTTEPLLEVSAFYDTRWNVFESVAYFYIVFYNNISHWDDLGHERAKNILRMAYQN